MTPDTCGFQVNEGFEEKFKLHLNLGHWLSLTELDLGFDIMFSMDTTGQMSFLPSIWVKIKGNMSISGWDTAELGIEFDTTVGLAPPTQSR